MGEEIVLKISLTCSGLMVWGGPILDGPILDGPILVNAGRSVWDDGDSCGKVVGDGRLFAIDR